MISSVECFRSLLNLCYLVARHTVWDVHKRLHAAEHDFLGSLHRQAMHISDLSKALWDSPTLGALTLVYS